MTDRNVDNHDQGVSKTHPGGADGLENKGRNKDIIGHTRQRMGVKGQPWPQKITDGHDAEDRKYDVDKNGCKFE